MSELTNLKQISARNIDAIDVMDVVDRLQNTEGQLTKNATILIDGEEFHFSLTPRGEGASVNVTKNYASGLLGSLQKFFGYRSSVAEALKQKMTSILRSNEYTQITNNLNQFRAVVRDHLQKGVKEIEVADYGLSPNRDLVAQHKLVAKVAQEFSSSNVSIRFNQIDSYNDQCGIEPNTICIAPLHLMNRSMKNTLSNVLNDIKNGTLKLQGSVKIPEEKLAAWAEFLKRPENFQKIDIVSKLNAYLHQGADSVLEKNTGWKADFKRNSEQALRNFVMKNLPQSHKDCSDAQLEQLFSDVKQYLEIMHNPDQGSRDKQLEAFFGDVKSWRSEEEQQAYEKRLAEELADDPSSTEAEWREYLDQTQFAVTTTKRFVALGDVFSYAFFRETSKLGLEFFKEQQTPVMFQYADYQGNLLRGEKLQQIFNENQHNKNEQGDAVSNKKARRSAITYSELRHAKRLQLRFKADFDLRLAHGGVNLQQS